MPANHRKRGVCTFPGCDKPHIGKGLCKGHYSQQYRGQALHPIGEQRASCTFPGCQREHAGRGLCDAHFQQHRRGKELRPVGAYYEAAANRKVCEFEGCDRMQICLGLCSAHDGQRRRTGILMPIGYRKPREPRSEKTDGREPKRRPKSRPTLPKGWDRTTPTAAPKRRAGLITTAEIPPVAPTPSWVLELAGRFTERHNAPDLAEMLGLTREAA